MVYIISQKQRVFDGLKLGSGFLLIVVNCFAAAEELSDLYSATNMSVFADANITGTFLHFFGRTKFIINFNKVQYKISTMVAFCPGGLLSV